MIRRATRLVAATNAGAGGSRNPAITIAIRNLSVAVPVFATVCSRLLPSGLSCGAIFAAAAFRLVEASIQKS
jgi:hypothetical protein